jgi:hypothetical protein
MKALAIIPAYTHIDHRLMQALLEAGVPFLPLHGSSDLPRARSILISLALARKPERVLFLDSDIVPTPAQLRELATSELVTAHQALTGLYAIRDTRATPGGGASWAVDALDPQAAAAGAELIPCRWAGLGFAAVSLASLERVAASLPEIAGDEVPWRPFCVPFFDGAAGAYYPDDRSFWWRLAGAGTRLLASQRLRVGHVAQVVLRDVGDAA